MKMSLDVIEIYMKTKMEVKASKDPGVELTSSLIDHSVQQKLFNASHSLSTIN